MTRPLLPGDDAGVLPSALGALPSLGHGDGRLPGSARDRLGPSTALDTDLTFYYVALGVFLVSGLLMYRLVRSPFGLTLRGIKDSELRMRTSGYNVWLHRFIVFVIAGLFAGIAGVLYTYSTQFISPTILGVETSFEAMLMVIVGGAGTLDGSAHRSGGRDRAPQLPERVFRQLADRSRVGVHRHRLLRSERNPGVASSEVASSVGGRTGAGGRRTRAAVAGLEPLPLESTWASADDSIARDAGRSWRAGNAPTRGHGQDLRITSVPCTTSR